MGWSVPFLAAGYPNHFVGELCWGRPWWPMQSSNKEGRKKKVKGSEERERGQIKFVDLRFERWHVVRFWKARRRQDASTTSCTHLMLNGTREGIQNQEPKVVRTREFQNRRHAIELLCQLPNMFVSSKTSLKIVSLS